MSRAGAVLALLLLLGGCKQSGSSTPAFELSDSAGTEIVVSRESQWGAGKALRLGSEPLMQIGGAGATDDPYLLTYVRACRG